MYIFVNLITGPGHVTFWRLCTDQELEKEKLAKMALKSESEDSCTDLEVSTSSLASHGREEPEQKSGVVNLLLHNVLEDQRNMIPGWFNILMCHLLYRRETCLYYELFFTINLNVICRRKTCTS